jgi:pilus assembly protein Flp/PilA
MFQYLKTLLSAKKGEKGQDLAEYALLIGLIALIVVVAVTILGTEISTTFSAIASEVGGWPIP